MGRLFSQRKNQDVDEACRVLVNKIDKWIDNMKIPRLRDYGIGSSDIEKIVRKTGNKNNPVQLDENTITKILETGI